MNDVKKTVLVHVDVLAGVSSSGSTLLVNELHDSGFVISIFSSNSFLTDAFTDMPKWLYDYGISWDMLRFHFPEDPDGEVEFAIHYLKELWSEDIKPIFAIVGSFEMQHALEDLGLPSIIVAT